MLRVARRMADDEAALAASAYTHVCTDFPEVDQPRLDALCASLQRALGRSPTPDYAAHPLCCRLVAGLAFGASRLPDAAPEGDLAGLVLPRAAPSRYAQAYAVGCVLRACALLQAPESGLQAGLAAYELPAEEPSPEDVPEVSVPAELDGEEVWAAEPDDDDCAYEALEALASCTVTGGRTAAAPAAAAAAAPLPRAELLRRLAHLLGTLSHEPLAALPPGAWASLGLGGALCGALRAAQVRARVRVRARGRLRRENPSPNPNTSCATRCDRRRRSRPAPSPSPSPSP